MSEGASSTLADSLKPAATADQRRAAARERAARFALELQRRARHARTRRRASSLATPPIGAIVQTLSIGSRSRPIAFSGLLMVLLPTLLASLYFGLIASSVYEAEARFAVRTGAISGIDALTSIAGLPSVTQVQDSLIVANFVASRAAVETLEGSIGLRSRYSADRIDYISRLSADAPIEKIVKFWQNKVTVTIESPSGIITARVRAYSPGDARTIADALVQASEQLVNRLGAKSRADLVSNSERELRDVENRLRDSRDRLNQLRNSQGVIDPQLTAQGINMLISELRGEAVRLEQEIVTTQRSISREAPQIQLMRTRLAAIREQSDALQAELTQRRDNGRDALSSVMTRFDQLSLERQVLEKQFTSAAASLEQARSAAARQQMYLATFVRPILPEEAVGPRRLLYPVLIALGLLIVWGILASLVSRRIALAG